MSVFTRNYGFDTYAGIPNTNSTSCDKFKYSEDGVTGFMLLSWWFPIKRNKEKSADQKVLKETTFYPC